MVAAAGGRDPHAVKTRWNVLFSEKLTLEPIMCTSPLRTKNATRVDNFTVVPVRYCIITERSSERIVEPTVSR